MSPRLEFTHSVAISLDASLLARLYYKKGVCMPGPWIPDMSKHSKIIDLSLKENVDNYIKAGWELIETRTAFTGDNTAILIYRIGWPKDAGDPIEPPKIDEVGMHPSSPDISNN